VCATPLRKRPTVATAVLTPLPPPSSSADAETIAMPASDPLNTSGLVSGFNPGQTFGNRYQIISLLGAGGMGAVYHVWDTELALSLALKIIRPESDPFAAQELERRFKRELVLARQVTHTNVIRIHDLGEINGIKYITMPFVHGTDLARLLATEGKLSVERSVALARQIVSGLRAAHEVGIVHRDLKPANILIADDEKAIITDFGIARSTDAASYATAATAAGAIIGTLAYMAPEQASGKPADQRSDIYALGLILYEMLVGKRGASGGDTALALLIERSKHAPPGLRTLDSTIPEPVERLVTKCLEPDPAARFQTSAEIEAALDQLDATGNERFKPQVAPVAPLTTNRRSWMVAAVAILVMVGVGVWMLQSRVDSPPPSPQQREPVSVLIADFQNDANEPVFKGSLEQALSIAIEGASFITTYSRATAQAQAAQLRPGAPLDLESAQLVAASEGLKVILTGSIALRASGSGYLMTVKAIDATANGKELATAQADVDDKASVLKGVQTVASTLRQALGDTTPESARLAAGETVTTTSLEALKLYSTAQDLSSSGNEEKAIEEYQKAIKLDPKFGRAYSGWATALFNIGKRDEAADQYKNAMNLLDRMTEREKYRTQGAYFLGPAASYDQAIESFRELVQRYPADRAAHNNLGLAYFHTLDFAKAKEHAQRALEIYPQNTRARNNYALYAMYSGDFKTAAEEATKVLEKNASMFKAHLVMAAAAFDASNLSGVRDAYARMAKTGAAAGISLSVHGLADLAMYEGRMSDAVSILGAGIAADEKANNRSAKGAKLAALAEAELALGQTSRAVVAAQNAIEAAREDATLVPAALVFIKAGRTSEARTIANELSQQFQPRSRAYGEMIHAELARAVNRRPESADALGRARKLSDLWLGRFLMGVVYVEGGRFELAEPEFVICQRRRGEATAIFLNDVPSLRYLAPLRYWSGRALDGQKKPAAADNYKAFLALRPEGSKDPLAADARKRVEALSSAPASAR
jgi:eukaryotic-like serine/threonine-protein kinase